MATVGDLYDFLQDARKYPSMFVHNWSLAQLETTCFGYDSALRSHRIEEFGCQFNLRFGEWLYDRFGWSGSVGWAHAICQESSSPESAFWRFFELLDQFRDENPGSFADT